MKRIILALAIACAFCISTYATDSATSGSCGENIFWTYADGELTISGSGKMNMESEAWRDLKPTLKTVYLDADVVSFETVEILGAPELESIIVAEDNTCFCDIDGVLFSKDKTELIFCPPKRENFEYTVPEGTKTIKPFAFSAPRIPVILEDEIKLYIYYSLSSVVLPDGLISIEHSAFNSCTQLEIINIPHSVEFIGESAFFNCSNLDDVCYEGTEQEWQAIHESEEDLHLRYENVHFQTTLDEYKEKSEIAPETERTEATYESTTHVCESTEPVYEISVQSSDKSDALAVTETATHGVQSYESIDYIQLSTFIIIVLLLICGIYYVFKYRE